MTLVIQGEREVYRAETSRILYNLVRVSPDTRFKFSYWNDAEGNDITMIPEFPDLAEWDVSGTIDPTAYRNLLLPLDWEERFKVFPKITEANLREAQDWGFIEPYIHEGSKHLLFWIKLIRDRGQMIHFLNRVWHPQRNAAIPREDIKPFWLGDERSSHRLLPQKFPKVDRRSRSTLMVEFQ